MISANPKSAEAAAILNPPSSILVFAYRHSLSSILHPRFSSRSTLFDLDQLRHEHFVGVPEGSEKD